MVVGTFVTRIGVSFLLLVLFVVAGVIVYGLSLLLPSWAAAGFFALGGIFFFADFLRRVIAMNRQTFVVANSLRVQGLELVSLDFGDPYVCLEIAVGFQFLLVAVLLSGTIDLAVFAAFTIGNWLMALVTWWENKPKETQT